MKVKNPYDVNQEKELDARILSYSQRVDKYENLSRDIKSKMSIIAWFRVIVAVLAIAFLSEYTEEGVWYWGVSGVVCISCFLFLVCSHSTHRGRLHESEFLKQLNLKSIKQLKKEWDDLPIPNTEEGMSFLKDLNIVGKGSLTQVLGEKSKDGMEMLLSWLSEPVSADLMKARQDAVDELSSEIDHRQEVSYLCSDFRNENSSLEKWKENGSAKNIPYFYTIFLLVIEVISIIATIYDTSLYPLVFVAISLNLCWTAYHFKRVGDVFKDISGMRDKLRKYSRLVKVILAKSPNSKLLNENRNKLLSGNTDASDLLKRLGSLIGWSEMRRAGIWYFVLQALTLWDFHIYRSLSNWKQKHLPDTEKWLSALTEYEVISSVASIPYDNPKWVRPDVSDSCDGCIVAKNISHPLIHDAYRVGNDVTIGPEGKVLLVTGSNMSGKSTLLRSLGINLLLSRIGAPVCADEMCIPDCLDVVSSFRISDSLAEGTSFYMAELKHIKAILDKIKDNHSKGRKTLYLLDEILQGTNSRDRHVAVVSIINEILGTNAIGVISSHDLELATNPKISNVCNPVYFKEDVSVDDKSNETVMSFDYKLHEGVSDTTNALELLKAVGVSAHN